MNRQDLIDYKSNKIWLEERIKEVEQRKELLNKLTATYGDSTGGSSNVNDRVAEDLVKLLDQTKEYMKMLVDMQQKQVEIENKLDELPNKNHRNILYFHYIADNNGKPYNLTETSNKVGLEYTYTVRQHGYALNEFDKICKNTINIIE